ncbi:MAG TPA: TIGR03619 family F420-dependent LLM class oxidoreductase [Acidimicrobiales bacterium]|nr:TIGR03619 family F420-dependent LLM class oxidoreductase [Acidimicrobiales bacterium]
MKIGISLGVLRPSLWAELTREADRLGYESVWMPEHLVIPVGMTGSPHAGSEHPPIPADVPVFDVFAYLSFLAGQTEQIHFGTQVYNIGLRHPFIVARAVATLDVVSNGRLEFGIGASWLQAEWEAVGLEFATRGRRVDESIELCRRLWSEDVVEHHGEFFDFGPVMFEPKPTQAPWPPLHIGGDGPAALRRAALVGDGWIPMNHTLEQIPADATRIARLREDAGRPGVVEVTLGGSGTGLDELKRYADAGVGRVLVRPWQRGSEAIDGIRRFAEQVLPEIRDHPVAPPAR